MLQSVTASPPFIGSFGVFTQTGWKGEVGIGSGVETIFESGLTLGPTPLGIAEGGVPRTLSPCYVSPHPPPQPRLDGTSSEGTRQLTPLYAADAR